MMLCCKKDNVREISNRENQRSFLAEKSYFRFSVKRIVSLAGIALCLLMMSVSSVSAASSLKISGVTTLSQKEYKVIPHNKGGIKRDSQVYIDRDYTFSFVPDFVEGNTYILTANDDKFIRASRFLDFQVNVPVIVYVAYDIRYEARPSWIVDDFEDTGAELKVGNTSRPYSMSLFKREYPAGLITLGGNYPAKDAGSGGMYVVIISEQE